MPINVAVATDIGRQRAINQDAVHAESFAATDAAILMVADGLGGHPAGEVASQMTVEMVARESRRVLADPTRTPGRTAAALLSLLADANTAIRERAAANPLEMGMGTTVVVAWIVHDEALIAHVGDSRAYGFQNGRLRQLTTDHSWVDVEVRAGRLTPEQARFHPSRNIVLRCLGTDERSDPEITGPVALANGDQLLLSTDGLHGVVLDDDIAGILSEDRGAVSASRLIAAANRRGGPDNIGVALAEFVATR